MPKKKLRDERFTVALTSEERERLEKNANDMGISMSTYVRMFIINSFKKEEKK